MTARPILFADYVPGAFMGERVEVYDQEQVRRWQSIFGQDEASTAAEGAGMAVIAMMRGYLNLVTPRPPGNVHARQQLRMHATPQRGESIRIAVHCTGKEIRRERKYVELKVQGFGTQQRPLFDATLSLIWSA